MSLSIQSSSVNNIYVINGYIYKLLVFAKDYFFDNNSINDPLLISHKLSNAQRLELDKEISLSELDYSLKTSNKASAPGPDGIPTSILSKFWYMNLQC